MGASGWSYFTPFRPNVAHALEELRQHVFLTKQYGDPALKPFHQHPGEMDGLTPEQRNQMEDLIATQARAIDAYKDIRGPEVEPISIDQLLELSAESGTHSIIDIYFVSDTRELGAAFPMPDDVKLDLYGTTRPTQEQVEAKSHARGEDLDRWQCWYVIVYKDDQPDEIYFEGCSGD